MSLLTGRPDHRRSLMHTFAGVKTAERLNAMHRLPEVIL